MVIYRIRDRNTGRLLGSSGFPKTDRSKSIGKVFYDRKLAISAMLEHGVDKVELVKSTLLNEVEELPTSYRLAKWTDEGWERIKSFSCKTEAKTYMFKNGLHRLGYKLLDEVDVS